MEVHMYLSIHPTAEAVEAAEAAKERRRALPQVVADVATVRAAIQVALAAWPEADEEEGE
jgi:hypothetical protein